MSPRRGRGRPPFPDQLTPAEWKVVEAVRHGLSNPDIAARQGVSVDAVKFHVAHALGKLGLRNRRELRHWPGVAKASALSSQPRSSAMDIQLGPIGQVARTVADIEAARHWYAKVLGLTHLYSFGKLAFFDCGGLRLFLSEGEGGASDSVLYFRVADIHAACEALRQRSVEFIDAPHLIHRHVDGLEEWMAFFKDVDDGTLALMSQVRQ